MNHPCLLPLKNQPMEKEEEEFSIQLSLGLGRSEIVPRQQQQQQPPKEQKQLDQFLLSFSPHMKVEINSEVHNFDRSISRTPSGEIEHKINTASFYSNNSSSSNNNNNDDKIAKRKKLVLTSEQVMSLEENFGQHSILTANKKQELAEQLNLQPRQVEVWFQNRRARTKMKQREVDCEFWKTYCEKLQDENRRLKMELQELKTRKLGSSSFYVHLPLTMTPSCDKYERRKERSRARREEPEVL